MVATATILGSDIALHGAGVGRWGWWRRARRRRARGRWLLAVLPAVPLLRPLLERAVAVAPAAPIPSAAAPHPPSGESPEREPEQEEQAEEDEQEPQDPKAGEERVEAVAVVRPGDRRRGAGGQVGVHPV